VFAGNLSVRTSIHNPQSINVFAATRRAQVRLEGITADQKYGEISIVITVGRDDNKRLDHEVIAPTRISLERTSDGEDKELLINSASGTTVVRLRAPIDTGDPA
jgi:hypothetical protein